MFENDSPLENYEKRNGNQNKHNSIKPCREKSVKRSFPSGPIKNFAMLQNCDIIYVLAVTLEKIAVIKQYCRAEQEARNSKDDEQYFSFIGERHKQLHV